MGIKLTATCPQHARNLPRGPYQEGCTLMIIEKRGSKATERAWVLTVAKGCAMSTSNGFTKRSGLFWQYDSVMMQKIKEIGKALRPLGRGRVPCQAGRIRDFFSLV